MLIPLLERYKYTDVWANFNQKNQIPLTFTTDLFPYTVYLKAFRPLCLASISLHLLNTRSTSCCNFSEPDTHIPSSTDTGPSPQVKVFCEAMNWTLADAYPSYSVLEAQAWPGPFGCLKREEILFCPASAILCCWFFFNHIFSLNRKYTSLS